MSGKMIKMQQGGYRKNKTEPDKLSRFCSSDIRGIDSIWKKDHSNMNPWKISHIPYNHKMMFQLEILHWELLINQGYLNRTIKTILHKLVRNLRVQ